MMIRTVIAYAAMLALCFLILEACAKNQAEGYLTFRIISTTALLLMAGLCYREEKPPKHGDNDGGDTL